MAKSQVNHSIATILHYCSNDYRFLHKSIEEIKHFSRVILIPVCDHFFNGKPENRELLERSFADFPECQFIEFKYDSKKLYHPYLSGQVDETQWSKFWHGTARYIGALFTPPDIEYTLFLDADEIIDGKRFKTWLDSEDYRNWNAIRMQGHAYLHRASLRTQASYSCSLLLRMPCKDLLASINHADRHGWFNALEGPKKEGVFDERGEPLIHHYTWVRTKEECLRKANTWAHRLEKDWKTPIERMFQDPTKDLMDLNAAFEEVPIFFDPMSVPLPQTSLKADSFSNVQKVDHAKVRRLEIERLL